MSQTSSQVGASNTGVTSAWRKVLIGEVVESQNGRAFTKEEWVADGLPIIRIENLRDAGAKHNYFKGELEDRFKVKRGDLLFAWSGTPGTSFGAHLWKGGDAALNQHIWNLRIDKEQVDGDWLKHALNAKVPEFIEKANGGVGLAHITKAKFNASTLLLPPIEVQRSIISQLEARLSRLDKAASDLRKVEAKLARHRAAVLAAATAGTLVPTEAELARREGRTYESASVLLDRILVERRARWEAEQIAAFRAKGLKPRDDKWKAKYQPPVAPDTTDLPALPEGWTWASTDQLAADEPRSITDGPFGSNLKSEHYTESGPRVIRLQNIGDGNFVDERAHIRPDHFASLANHHVHPGDIVLAALGEVLPRACLIPDDLGPALVKADCMRVKPDPALVVTRYLLAALISPQVQHRTASVVKGVGRPRINLGTVRGLPLPLPPLAEQRRIVLALEQGQTVYTQTLRAATASRRRVVGLRSAILQAAFQPPEVA